MQAHTLKLGPSELDTPVLQAPIAGSTDATSHAVVRDLGGCGPIFTAMVSAEAWIKGQFWGS